LLTKILDSGCFDIQRMAEELVVSERTVALYMSGELEMPLERQLCLARFLIDNAPALARTGHNLLGQVQSAIAYSRSETTTHLTCPTPNSRSY
jgi:hypothetical protein